MHIDWTPDVLARLVPSGLSCLACLWLFLRYFIARNRSIGFSMVFVLAMADFIFSASFILITFEENISPQIYFAIFFVSIHFSIYWASGIAILVYKSLKDVDFNSRKSFLIVFLIVFAISGLSSLLLTLQVQDVLLFLPIMATLVISLLLTCIYYSKCIGLLKQQSEFEMKSTNIYIKNLRMYSFIQLLTYGPILMYLFASTYSTIDPTTDQYLAMATEILAGLSGLFSVLIFMMQGPLNYKKCTSDQLESDLTQDLIQF